MTQFMENENRLRELLTRQQAAPWPTETAAEEHARAMSADYVEMHELRDLPAPKKDRRWHGGRVIKTALVLIPACLAFVAFLYWIFTEFKEPIAAAMAGV